ncbi:MAG: hypothetical protein LBP59_14110 [Planctomycetaceae bacterium]|jgi:hypothetical protein|nr:hypothetical protein [Planctomycetaceae bacterium]
MMRRFLFVTLISSIMLFIGCSQSAKPLDFPDLYPCTVIITQEGKPVADAIVEFIRQDADNTKYVPVQHTNNKGIAVMTTYGFTGAPAGKYKIIVTKNVEDETVIKDKDTGEIIIVSETKYKLIDPAYSDTKTTPLEIEVLKEKNVKQTFDVGKAIKIKY